MGALWVTAYLAVLLWSADAPKDAFTWFLEALPALVALPLLAATRRRFPLTPLAYVLIWLHASILLVGAHYTYAEVPLFDTLREVFHWQRNNYDKVGHFAQGFVPAILAREILLRLNRPLKNFQSNTPHPLISTLGAAQKELRGDFCRLPGPFSGHLAPFGRTYPRTHA
jgi:uncharacterized membrane protein YjdF